MRRESAGLMHPPMVHIYLTALFPSGFRRSRRYAAFQLEYVAAGAFDAQQQ
jgi:hypothetical protein